jgi:hypothetical protein
VSAAFRGPGGYGCLPDPDTVRTPSSRVLLGTASTPSAATLRAHTPSVPLDQGPTSSCVGHAFAASIFASLSAAGTPLPDVPSPVGIYTLARCIDRAATEDGGDLPPLVDTGSFPDQAARALREWGCGATITDWPTDPARINDEPTLGKLRGQSLFKLVGHYKINTYGGARVLDIRRALAAGFAVTCAVDVDEAFEAYDGGVLGARKGDNLGGHYIYLHGYDTEVDGKTVFEGTNSWGIGWGALGRFRGDEAFAARLRDLYVMKVRRALCGRARWFSGSPSSPSSRASVRSTRLPPGPTRQSPRRTSIGCCWTAGRPSKSPRAPGSRRSVAPRPRGSTGGIRASSFSPTRRRRA